MHIISKGLHDYIIYDMRALVTASQYNGCTIIHMVVHPKTYTHFERTNPHCVHVDIAKVNRV
jgi:lactam utilization protein B